MFTFQACLKSLLAIALIWTALPAQTYHLALGDRSPIPGLGIHVTILSEVPKHNILLPSGVTARVRYFSAFYTWKTLGSNEIDGMVIQDSTGETIYFDHNRNRDLRDDGPPARFPCGENNFAFDIRCEVDTEQFTRMRFQRRPELPDTDLVRCVLPSGDLNPRFARFWANATSQPAYSGERGSFYFDSRLGFVSAQMTLDSFKCEIGLLDWSNNGLFNDVDDLVLVRSIPSRIDGTFDEYSQNDVFEIGGGHARVTAVDKYGSWMNVTVTTEEPTSRLVNPRPAIAAGEQEQRSPIVNLWKRRFKNVEGSEFNLGQYEGSYLLLNFWGEWCKPCLAEIPALVEANHSYGKRGLKVVGFVFSKDMVKAKAIIQERQMTWPQLILTDSTALDFGIRAYPTNVLITPTGETFVQKGQLSKGFIEAHIK
jgi:thiol-disulfide isomerase/thioredoxin